MVQTFAKGLSVPLTEHFASTDFDCHCRRPACELTLIDPALPPALETLWAITGPFKIDSGFRCEKHNEEIGGAPSSQHTQGRAADCKSLVGKSGIEMAAAAELVPQFHNGGIGIYFAFAHLDTRDGKARWKGGSKLSLIAPC